MRQETLVETQKLRHDVDMMKRDQESTVNKLESLEQENHILQITLQQRDAEIERQQEVLEYDGFYTSLRVGFYAPHPACRRKFNI